MVKNYIIFGGCGFIGTNMCLRKLADGNKVICVDNMESGYYSNLEMLKKDKNFHFVYGDITNDDIYFTLKQDIAYFFDNKVDEVFNFACVASPKLYQRNPLHTLNTCLAIDKIIRFAGQWSNVKILHSSTSEVYGDPIDGHHPQKETYNGNVNVIGDRSCYDEGKRCAETICHEHWRNGVDVRVIRIFNTCGEYMNPEDGRILVNFISQVIRNEDITVYGDGMQTRCICYIDDLLDGIEAFMKMKRKCFGPVNLGNPEEYSVIDIAYAICDELGYDKGKITFSPLPSDDPKMRCPDISRAKLLFDFQPKFKLNEIINRMNKYLLEHVKGTL